MNLHPRIYRSITGRWPTQEEPPEQVLSEMERIADTEMLCLLIWKRPSAWWQVR